MASCLPCVSAIVSTKSLSKLKVSCDGFRYWAAFSSLTLRWDQPNLEQEKDRLRSQPRITVFLDETVVLGAKVRITAGDTIDFFALTKRKGALRIQGPDAFQ